VPLPDFVKLVPAPARMEEIVCVPLPVSTEPAAASVSVPPVSV